MKKPRWERLFDIGEKAFSAIGAILVGVWILSRTVVTFDDQTKAFAEYDKQVDSKFESLKSQAKRIEDSLNHITKRVDRIYERGKGHGRNEE